METEMMNKLCWNVCHWHMDMDYTGVIRRVRVTWYQHVRAPIKIDLQDQDPRSGTFHSLPHKMGTESSWLAFQRMATTFLNCCCIIPLIHVNKGIASRLLKDLVRSESRHFRVPHDSRQTPSPPHLLRRCVVQIVDSYLTSSELLSPDAMLVVRASDRNPTASPFP